MTFREFIIKKLEADPDLTKREKKTVIAYYHRGSRKRIVSIPKLDSPRYLNDFHGTVADFLSYYYPLTISFYSRIIHLIVEVDSIVEPDTEKGKP